MKTKPSPPARESIPLQVAEHAEAKQEWIRVTRVLAGKLDERDRSLLIDYCLTYNEIIELQDLVYSEGRVLQGAKGGSYINPMVNLLISRQSHMASLRRDLYFTPKSRIEKQSKKRSPGQSIRESITSHENQEEDAD